MDTEIERPDEIVIDEPTPEWELPAEKACRIDDPDCESCQ